MNVLKKASNRKYASKGEKTSVLKINILRKLLEHFPAERCCAKVLDRARRRAVSSSFEQFRATLFLLEQLHQNTSLQNASLFLFGMQQRNATAKRSCKMQLQSATAKSSCKVETQLPSATAKCSCKVCKNPSPLCLES